MLVSRTHLGWACASTWNGGSKRPHGQLCCAIHRPRDWQKLSVSVEDIIWWRSAHRPYHTKPSIPSNHEDRAGRLRVDRHLTVTEGSLEVKLRTIWTHGKAEVRRVQEEKKRSEKIREEKRKKEKKEDAGARKGRKGAIHYVFQWFVALEGRKVGSLKQRVRSQLARWEMKNCTPLWREAHFQVKMYKAHHSQTTSGSWDVEKCTPLWHEAHFRVKMCKTPHVRTTFGSWDVEKVQALSREAYVQVKMYKTPHFRTTFGSWDVEKVYAVVAWSTFPSQECNFFLTFRCRKSVRRCGAKHIWKSNVSKTEGFKTLLDVQLSNKCALTNLTNLTNLTCLTNLTNLTNTTDLAHLTNLAI